MLENEILEIVKKSLPEQVSGLFKEFVQESKKIKDERDFLKSEVDKEKIRCKEKDDRIVVLSEVLSKTKSELEKLQSLANSVTERERVVTQREVKQEIKEIRTQEAEKRADTIKDLVSIVFRNPRFVTTESRTYPVEKKQYSTYYENGFQKMVESGKYDSTETETKTTTQEQE